MLIKLPCKYAEGRHDMRLTLICALLLISFERANEADTIIKLI